MHKNTGTNATVDGEFTDGDAELGQPRSILGAEWLNTFQRELVNAVEGLGGVLDPDNDSQLLEVLQGLVALSAPAGQVTPYAGITAPTGWLFCDGAAASRATYPSLLAAVTFSQAGDTTNGSAIVTGLASTGNMRAGMAVTGAGVPAGASILTVDGPAQITLSANATATAADVSLTFYLYGAGDGVTTFNVPDLRGEFLRGLDRGRGVDVDRRPGSAQSQQTQAHKHALPIATDGVGGGGNIHYGDSPFGSSTVETGIGTPRRDDARDLGGTEAADLSNDVLEELSGETRPRNVAMNYIIKT